MRKRETPRRRLAGRLGSIAFTTVLLTAVLAFLVVALGPHVLGYRTSTMLTGSMEPAIQPGDVVLSVPRPAEDVQVGDVITYHIPIEDRRVETHRIVEVVRDGDSIAVRTKGDANDGVDPWLATLEGDTVWEMQLVIPVVGDVIRALRTPAVQDHGLWIALALVLTLGMSMIWSRDDELAAAPRPLPVSARTSLDVTVLSELAAESSDTIAARFATRYTEMLPLRIERVRTAVEARDADRALDSALSLKVSSGTVGTGELAVLASSLESAVLARDWVEAHRTSAQLEDAAGRAERALESYLAPSLS